MTIFGASGPQVVRTPTGDSREVRMSTGDSLEVREYGEERHLNLAFLTEPALIQAVVSFVALHNGTLSSVVVVKPGDHLRIELVIEEEGNLERATATEEGDVVHVVVVLNELWDWVYALVHSLIGLSSVNHMDVETDAGSAFSEVTIEFPRTRAPLSLEELERWLED